MLYTFCFLGLGVLYVIYERLILSPLGKVPGPPVAAVTRLVLMYYEFTRRRRHWIHELHMKYGPVVRIAPDEVSFADWNAVKEIYVSDGSGYDKTLFYSLFDNYNTQCMFSTLDKVPHAEKKKRFAEKYSKSYIMQPDTMDGIKERAEEFLAKCTEKAGATVDLYVYLHCYALDCITYHLFDPHGVRSLTNASDFIKVKELSYHDNLRDSYFQYYFTDLFYYGSRLFRRFDRSKRIAAQILNTVRRSDIAEHTVLRRLQEHEGELDTRAIASELLDHTLAGIDTTGDALCFLMYHLSVPSSIAIQEKLHNELVENPSIPIDDLPYLDAVVKEGLRCFAPIPMSQPRKVPSGGRTIGQYYFPEDTIVSSQAYTLHRFDTQVFPNPDEFIPERWLKSEGAMERNQLFFVFSSGGRGCIGKHLALLEIKMLLREVYSTYRTRVVSETTALMEAEDQFISTRPRGKVCSVTFEKFM